ncbi:phosphoenolpyruvate--protein phosphotransferase [Arthrobacter sp. MA-N2]|uniref:phosphoenolpyruvate--protein phosphotransferase n=1 Tax=Arthrobacter sp. MA-N2 TaxID=1101188 RepID=UPI0004BBF8D1|nr:phosphoenolpyruvate--protein phosphotransferase [Arthrobacter sp. MA-N2]
MKLLGLGVSPGRATALVQVFRDERFMFSDEEPEERSSSSLSNLDTALRSSKAELLDVVADATERLGAGHAAIFEVQLSMMDDAEWLDPIVAGITAGGDAARVVWTVSGELADELQLLDDPYLRERSADIRDLAKRVVRHLQETNPGASAASARPLVSGTEPVILFAQELTPSDTMGLDPSMVRAIVTEAGARTSHAAILARQLGIPAVVSVPGLMALAEDGIQATVDGSTGELQINPSASDLAAFSAVEESVWEIDPNPVHTLDGIGVAVYANAGSAEDVSRAVSFGADGVGLFRTELLFIKAGQLLDEQAQFLAYCAAAKEAAGRPVVFRTLDIGGDKPLPGLSVPTEENPFLGLRGVRLSLAHRDVFSAQLRALGRASAEYSNIRVMVPMVSELRELDEVRELIAAAEVVAPLRIGVMIEVPSAAILAHEFAEESDFLSIGSNDLTAYLMASDRNNPGVQHLYNEISPAVVRMLAFVARAGSTSGTPVSLCGELAGDARVLPLLVGLGLRSLSVAPGLVPRLKAQIQMLDTRLLAGPAKEAIRARDPRDMENILDRLNTLPVPMPGDSVPVRQ